MKALWLMWVWMQLNRLCLKHQAASEQLMFHLQWILRFTVMEGLWKNIDPCCSSEPGCGWLSQSGQTTTARGRPVMCCQRSTDAKNKQTRNNIKSHIESEPTSPLPLPDLASPALHPPQSRPPSVLITHICSQSLDPSCGAVLSYRHHLDSSPTNNTPPHLNPTLTLIHKN